jgi:methylglutaconyl-CoA hydratase
MHIGLVHVIKPASELDAAIEQVRTAVFSSAPGATARAKALIAHVPELDQSAAMQLTAETIAALRVAPEGQEGLRAFLEKRIPEWAG